MSCASSPTLAMTLEPRCLKAAKLELNSDWLDLITTFILNLAATTCSLLLLLLLLLERCCSSPALDSGSSPPFHSAPFYFLFFFLTTYMELFKFQIFLQ